MTTKPTGSWRPSEMGHRVLVLGPPHSLKALTEPGGKVRYMFALLIEADGELRLWKFGQAVFRQLRDIEEDRGLDNVWLEVRKNIQGRFPRIDVRCAEQRT